MWARSINDYRKIRGPFYKNNYRSAIGGAYATTHCSNYSAPGDVEVFMAH